MWRISLPVRTAFSVRKLDTSLLLYNNLGGKPIGIFVFSDSVSNRFDCQLFLWVLSSVTIHMYGVRFPYVTKMLQSWKYARAISGQWFELDSRSCESHRARSSAV